MTVGGSLLIYALRAPKVSGGEPFAAVSRETLLLVNNLLFTCAAAMVLLGTLYPLIGEAFDLGRISVGPPYFGFMFVLLMAPVALLIPLGPLLKWSRGDLRGSLRKLFPAMVLALIACVLTWLMTDPLSAKAYVGVAASLWVGLGILAFTVMRWRNAPKGRRFKPEMLGMVLAHFGFAVFLAGVLVTEGTSIEKDVRLEQGETAVLGDYTFRFDGVERVDGPNFVADQGTITITKVIQRLPY